METRGAHARNYRVPLMISHLMPFIASDHAARKPEVRKFRCHRASARLAWPRFSGFDRRRRNALHAVGIDAEVTVGHGTTRCTRLAVDLAAPHIRWYR